MPIHFRSLLIALLVIASLVAVGPSAAFAEGPAVYQRHRQSWGGGFQNSYHNSYFPPQRQTFHAPRQQISSGYFQRPYPYHLDYYRMRYGGGYDPYFGNLYGPPAVYAPSYGAAPY